MHNNFINIASFSQLRNHLSCLQGLVVTLILKLLIELVGLLTILIYKLLFILIYNILFYN